jgi:predicted RNase H-like HicB family nuclease
MSATPFSEPYAPHPALERAEQPLDLHSILATVPVMNYRVTLFQSDEGWAVSCPDLPGCHSQGATREEALENIKEAIRLWLEVEAEETGLKRFEQAEVVV